MRRDVPEGAVSFVVGLFPGEANVTQQVVIHPGKVAPLRPQRSNQRQKAQGGQAMPGACGRDREDTEHGGAFHMKW
jgi:hypothetical protein